MRSQSGDSLVHALWKDIFPTTTRMATIKYAIYRRFCKYIACYCDVVIFQNCKLDIFIYLDNFSKYIKYKQNNMQIIINDK